MGGESYAINSCKLPKTTESAQPWKLHLFLSLLFSATFAFAFVLFSTLSFFCWLASPPFIADGLFADTAELIDSLFSGQKNWLWNQSATFTSFLVDRVSMLEKLDVFKWMTTSYASLSYISTFFFLEIRKKTSWRERKCLSISLVMRNRTGFSSKTAVVIIVLENSSCPAFPPWWQPTIQLVHNSPHSRKCPGSGCFLVKRAGRASSSCREFRNSWVENM